MNSNEEYLDGLLKSVVSDTVSESNASMTNEEIEAMFLAAEKVAEREEEDSPVESFETDTMEEAELETEPDVELGDEFSEEIDLAALLGEASGNDDLSEIGELLDKVDNNVLVEDDLFAMLEGLDDESQQAGEEPFDVLNAIEEEEVTSKKSKKEKRRKRKSKEVPEEMLEESEAAREDDLVVKSSTKKKGFFAQMFASLIEEEEGPNFDGLDENEMILNELEEEDIANIIKEKKTKKSKKQKKNKNGKGTESVEEDEEGANKKKKTPKKNKKVKQKKDKKQKPEKVEEKPRKKMAPKSIFVIFLLGGSVLACVMFLSSLGTEIYLKSSAKTAFVNKNYAKAYEELAELNLNEKEENMLHYAESVLRIQKRVDDYELYMYLKKELSAVDSLIQAIAKYDEYYQYAQNYNATEEVSSVYDKILTILAEEYGIDEETAKMIAMCKSDVDYTRYLTALVDGEQIEDLEDADIRLPKEDILPEELELQDTSFFE